MPSLSKTVGSKREERAVGYMSRFALERDESSDAGSSLSATEDDDASSELDETDCERRRMECLDEMSDLEQQFMDIRDHRLYRERLNQVDSKLEEVTAERGPEYMEPLNALRRNMEIRTEVAGVYRELCLIGVKNKHECEKQAAMQNLQNEKVLVFEALRGDLEERIRRLEEDRCNADITSEQWGDDAPSKWNKRKSDVFGAAKRKKPVTVASPYIVYMLKEVDILEDWTAIKKCYNNHYPHWRGIGQENRWNQD
ncbi:breast cancer metastasis-suppressor 1-like protein-A isoform X1 [Lethenteron reissneri]|uniref:breast cancer metastasis-suppressor 1-like protein-A isoform X1 n=1 Tax=Lethenteron reissneri TaxID=7753 RepID=UPI002AB7397D|nr:breast cancer metastasis-suppressor 1-like protein-A isoform X1 [Lethenteron reissneri]